MRTLLLVLAALVGSSHLGHTQAPCVVFRGGCSSPTSTAPVQIVCSSLPNICCPAFQLDARGFDPGALGTVCLITDCSSRVPFGPPLGCDLSCVLYQSLLTSYPVFPAGGALTQTFSVPCWRFLVGGRFCVQYAQLVPTATGTCVSLSDAIRVEIGPQGSC